MECCGERGGVSLGAGSSVREVGVVVQARGDGGLGYNSDRFKSHLRERISMTRGLTGGGARGEQCTHSKGRGSLAG